MSAPPPPTTLSMAADLAALRARYPVRILPSYQAYAGPTPELLREEAELDSAATGLMCTRNNHRGILSDIWDTRLLFCERVILRDLVHRVLPRFPADHPVHAEVRSPYGCMALDPTRGAPRPEEMELAIETCCDCIDALPAVLPDLATSLLYVLCNTCVSPKLVARVLAHMRTYGDLPSERSAGGRDARRG